MNKLCVYLPCYNEAENIDNLVCKWISETDKLKSEGLELFITCVDDKSTDNTLRIICDLSKRYPSVSVIAHSQNKNLGGVLMTSIRDFLDKYTSRDLMCFMDADNTHKPFYIHSMLKKLKAIPSDNACVIASRYQKGAAVQGLESSRRLLSEIAGIYYSVIIRVPNVKDYTCGYRLYTHTALCAGWKKYAEKLVECHTFACMMELLFKLYKSGCHFDEVPFCLYYDHKVGKSKMKIFKTVKDSLFTALRLRLFLR